MTAVPIEALAPEISEPPPEQRPRALSPSRAADFMHCPLLYRFRTIDKLPQPPDSAATRGTVVHAVLERLFDLEPEERTLPAAAALLRPEWERLLEEEPELASLFADDTDGAAVGTWLTSAESLLATYFDLEDPTRLRPAERELIVECELPSGLRLRGIVDRLDVASGTGAMRVVDYKTGRSPAEAFEARALFQMKFYALVLWRTRGVIPRILQLIYLGNREVLRYAPDEADLRATERKLEALWTAITQAERSGDFRPSPGRLCEWCAFHELCPAKGGVTPPYPGIEPAPAG
ncbi:MAG: putative RecB family exonuclease [Frankiales bacterium]|jgi:putative RecB family exonuclease|nr:putative RecB family exonuclease [Frankiales bacterium]